MDLKKFLGAFGNSSQIFEGIKNNIFKKEHIEAEAALRWSICKKCDSLDTNVVKSAVAVYNLKLVLCHLVVQRTSGKQLWMKKQNKNLKQILIMKIELFESEINAIDSNEELGEYVRSKMLFVKSIDNDEAFEILLSDLNDIDNSDGEAGLNDSVIPEDEYINMLENVSISAYPPNEWVSTTTSIYNLDIKF